MTGLAILLVASAAPVAAVAEAEERAPALGSRAGADDTVVDGGPAASEGHWPLELLARIDGALASLGQAIRGAGEALPTEGRTVRQRRQREPRPFSMNLFRRGDFSSQRTTFWCIPASTQMMMNMMDGGRPNRSRAMQARLYRIGDRLEEDGTFSREPEPDYWRGMGISEWTGLLNRFDYGPYELAGSRSYRKALRTAARMLRKTGKPVGLVVWHGAHAWVMSGFTATADPATSKDFEVTSIWVQDPWYPRTSSVWGRSRGPNANVSPGVLREDFRRYGRPGRRNPDRDGRFMLVLPRPDREARAAS
jgi:hypothetical protein